MYDLVIVGGGPGGLTAALYALRATMKVLIVEQNRLGGQILSSEIIENYPGVGEISGQELMNSFEDQLKKYDPQIIFDSVKNIKDNGSIKTVELSSKTVETKSIIVASGARPNMLGVPGEKEYTGRGVSYCATCDGPLFADQDILVVGGGDTAVKEALYLSKIARTVYIVHRRDSFRAEKIYHQKIEDTPNIQVLWSSTLQEIKGDGLVKQVVIKDLKTELVTPIDVSGVFVFVGTTPNTDMINCKKDSKGFIETDKSLQSSIKGVFAIGDCRDTGLRQVATAVGDGAMAAISAENYLES